MGGMDGEIFEPEVVLVRNHLDQRHGAGIVQNVDAVQGDGFGIVHLHRHGFAADHLDPGRVGGAGQVGDQGDVGLRGGAELHQNRPVSVIHNRPPRLRKSERARVPSLTRVGL